MDLGLDVLEVYVIHVESTCHCPWLIVTLGQAITKYYDIVEVSLWNLITKGTWGHRKILMEILVAIQSILNPIEIPKRIFLLS